ncbi:chromatin structure-remodeling complex subunit RSC7 [Malassezia brasiliensis]|uniref:Chromatin structure-remodeling complex subunit RSC7 n=1 Tax=Malassezia brasiliensis TaxID=1821822 RepID=A0AAF0IQD4_9BASI|nr:chromatin structure-remodeling complex subunit RSC7 [Malassezia brasiliensis]
MPRAVRSTRRRDDAREPAARPARPRRSSARARMQLDEDEDEDEAASEDSDTSSDAAPARRRSRSRPARARAAPESESEQEDEGEEGDTIEIDGREYHIADDQLSLDTDAAGETKIDASGHLLGGRTFRVPTFALPTRSDPTRQYMLSIDVARALGFRDSAYFFRKHPLLHKLVLSAEEKEALAGDARVAGQLRVRNVTVVTARSVFQLVGARIVTKGRMVLDDYYEALARREGHREGALVSMPSIEGILRAERRRESDRERDRGRRRPDAATYTTVDPHGEAVVTTFGDAGHTPFERAGPWAQRRLALQRADLTEENWIAEYARGVAALNADLAESRRERRTALPHPGVRAPSAAPLQDGAAVHAADEEHAVHDVRPPWERARDAESAAARAARQAAARAQRLRARRIAEPPVGVFEPHTYRMQVARETQPVRAVHTKVHDAPQLAHAPGAARAQLATVETYVRLHP